MGKYGLSDNELDVMLHILSANERISKVILYGSHAKGIYKQFSDIDPAIVGEELTRKDFNALKDLKVFNCAFSLIRLLGLNALNALNGLNALNVLKDLNGLGSRQRR